MGERAAQGRFEFSEGRVTAQAAIAELAAATGMMAEELTGKIPELTRGNLGFIVNWRADRFNTGTETGRLNAAATASLVEMRIPDMDVSGARQDMTGIRRSHFINAADGTVLSFEDFGGVDEWLDDNLGVADPEVLAELMQRAVPSASGEV